jgi:hypothetical protein
MIDTALDEGAGKSIGRLGTRELAYLFGLDQQGRTLPSTARTLPSTTIAGPSNPRPLAATNGQSTLGSSIARMIGVDSPDSRADSSSTMSFE